MVISSRAQSLLFALLACLFTSSGLVCQKYSHNVGEMRKPMLHRWRWMLGMIAILMGGVCDSLALSCGPLSGIAPLSGVTILLNSLFASYFLGEIIRLVEIFATFIIFGGATLTSVFGANPVPAHSVQELFELFGRSSFTIYLTIVATVVIFCLLILRASTGTWVYHKMAPFCYAAVAAGLGGIELVMLKCVVEVLTVHFVHHKDQFSEPDAAILIGIFALTAGLQLYTLNLGLAACNAVRLLPVYQSIFIFNAVSGGAAYFHEFNNFSQKQWTYFPAGVSLVLLGTLILTCTGSAPETAEPTISKNLEVEMQEGDAPLLVQAVEPGVVEEKEAGSQQV